MTPDERTLREELERWPGVRLAVLFGSSARGEARRGSDLDVGVLFDAGITGRASLEVALGRATRRPAEVVDLATAPPLLRFEIARDGRVILERVPHAWADFRARAMTDWWDWAPLARLIQEAAARRLRAAVADGPR
jgi:predicted nucleotidyltransferase